MRYVLIGDGQSPHLLKWARALAVWPGIELWAVSSRDFLADFDVLIAPHRRLALSTSPNVAGGNVALLRCLPRLLHWLHHVRPDWLHAHYLSSHGTLAWLAQRFGGVRGRLIGSAWGSDILVAPERSRMMRWLTRRVLRHCALATSDSESMAQRMHALGAAEVMVFPFGLEVMPAAALHKGPWLFFSNRALEPIYAPQRVLRLFANVLSTQPEARLVVANDGSLRTTLESLAKTLHIEHQVQFVGRLDPGSQATHYAQAQWYVSLPSSDSVAVSVLEAMAQGCIPLLSDLPANHELVRSGDNGLILPADTADTALTAATLLPLQARAAAIAQHNRAWVEQHALFTPAVARFMARVEALA